MWKEAESKRRSIVHGWPPTTDAPISNIISTPQDHDFHPLFLPQTVVRRRQSHLELWRTNPRCAHVGTRGHALRRPRCTLHGRIILRCHPPRGGCRATQQSSRWCLRVGTQCACHGSGAYSRLGTICWIACTANGWVLLVQGSRRRHRCWFCCCCCSEKYSMNYCVLYILVEFKHPKTDIALLRAICFHEYASLTYATSQHRGEIY